jgi:hypothetical protein
MPIKCAWDVANGDLTRELNGVVRKTSVATHGIMSCSCVVSCLVCVLHKACEQYRPAVKVSTCNNLPPKTGVPEKIKRALVGHRHFRGWGLALLSQATQEHLKSSTGRNMLTPGKCR